MSDNLDQAFSAQLRRATRNLKKNKPGGGKRQIQRLRNIRKLERRRVTGV
tara:strand:- start:48 stop:197 length:150 start_codon:yes stop_codon:yes gene_type:complete